MARIAIIAITTSSSIRVKAFRMGFLLVSGWMGGKEGDNAPILANFSPKPRNIMKKIHFEPGESGKIS